MSISVTKYRNLANIYLAVHSNFPSQSLILCLEAYSSHAQQTVGDKQRFFVPHFWEKMLAEKQTNVWDKYLIAFAKVYTYKYIEFTQ